MAAARVAQRALDVAPARIGHARRQRGERDQDHGQGGAHPGDEQVVGSAAMATPPALSASAVLSQVRKVRSFASVKRGSGSIRTTLIGTHSP